MTKRQFSRLLDVGRYLSVIICFFPLKILVYIINYDKILVSYYSMIYLFKCYCNDVKNNKMKKKTITSYKTDFITGMQFVI